MTQRIIHIGFDADDTLWHCEDLFFAAHQRLQKLLLDRSIEDLSDAVYDVERRNLERYDYGAKKLYPLTFRSLFGFEKEC